MPLRVTEKQEAKLKDMAVNFRKKNLDILASAIEGKCTDKNSYVPLGDFADFIRYCDFVIRGEYLKAKLLAHSMDTSSRDMIPYYLWETIEYKLP